MQRDMELINTMLRGIASKPVAFVGVGNLAHERQTAVALGLDPSCWPEDNEDILWLGNTQEEIDEHLRLLVEAGFLQEGGVTIVAGLSAFRVTNEGHEYINLISRPGVWEKIMDLASEPTTLTEISRLARQVPSPSQ